MTVAAEYSQDTCRECHDQFMLRVMVRYEFKVMFESKVITVASGALSYADQDFLTMEQVKWRVFVTQVICFVNFAKRSGEINALTNMQIAFIQFFDSYITRKTANPVFGFDVRWQVSKTILF